MITKEEAITHNEKVLKNVMVALIENHLADPIKMLTDNDYLVEKVADYIEAANMVRKEMGMPLLFLYDVVGKEKTIITK